MADRIEAAEKLARLIGRGERSSELWAAAVALNDGLTEFNRQTLRCLDLAEQMAESASIGPDSEEVVGLPA